MTLTSSNPRLPALTLAERERYFKKIYSRTHPDFKGEIDGVKTLISYAKFGSGLTCLKSISDDELRERYESARR